MERERDLGKENRSEHHVDVIYFYAKMYFEKQQIFLILRGIFYSCLLLLMDVLCSGQ